MCCIIICVYFIFFFVLLRSFVWYLHHTIQCDCRLRRRRRRRGWCLFASSLHSFRAVVLLASRLFWKSSCAARDAIHCQRIGACVCTCVRNCRWQFLFFVILLCDVQCLSALTAHHRMRWYLWHVDRNTRLLQRPQQQRGDDTVEMGIKNACRRMKTQKMGKNDFSKTQLAILHRIGFDEFFHFFSFLQPQNKFSPSLRMCVDAEWIAHAKASTDYLAVGNHLSHLAASNASRSDR